MEMASRLDSPEDLNLKRRILLYLDRRLPSLDALEVEAHHGTAVLHGTVRSTSIRWRCLDCCRHVAGVLNVIDRLVVEPADHGLVVFPDE
jgi:hypothetical protein